MRTHITWSPYLVVTICVHEGVQCSDKIRFPRAQLRMKCGVAKSCPDADTALQVPIPRSVYCMRTAPKMIYVAKGLSTGGIYPDDVMRFNTSLPNLALYLQ